MATKADQMTMASHGNIVQALGSFADRYGPMLYLLNSVERNIDYLATKSTYRRDLALNYREQQRANLRSYLIELERDYREMVNAGNGTLAPELVDAVESCTNIYFRANRFVRFRLAFDRLVPVPDNANTFQAIVRNLIRTVLLRMSPRSDRPKSLLSAMDRVRDLLAANPPS